MIAANTFQLIVVTPETTLLDLPATSVQFPLEDGQIGILPSRAPMVGRLGLGELIVQSAAGRESYFIEGGFVQVKGGAVTLLTNEARKLSEFDAHKIQAEFDNALNQSATSPLDQANKDQKVARTRKILSLLNRR